MSTETYYRVSILPGETDENAGFHKDVGETLAVSLFPPEGWRPVLSRRRWRRQ